MAGAQPFFVKDGQLYLTLKPILPGWFFAEDDTVTFKFLGQTTVVYHNPERRDTFAPQTVIRSIILHPVDEDSLELAADFISAPYAQKVRDGKVRQIDVYFA